MKRWILSFGAAFVLAVCTGLTLRAAAVNNSALYCQPRGILDPTYPGKYLEYTSFGAVRSMVSQAIEVRCPLPVGINVGTTEQWHFVGHDGAAANISCQGRTFSASGEIVHSTPIIDLEAGGDFQLDYSYSFPGSSSYYYSANCTLPATPDSWLATIGVY